MAQNTGASRPELRELSARLWPRAARTEPLRMRRAPLLAAAICFAFGDAAMLPTKTSPQLQVIALAVMLAAAVLVLPALPRAPRLALFAACMFWVAIGWFSARIEPQTAPQRALISYADGLSRRVEARVVRVRELPQRGPDPSGDSDSDPDQWDEPGSATRSVDLEITAIEAVTPDTSRMVPASGGVRVLLLSQPAGTARSGASFALPQLACGGSVALPIRLRIPERYRDPGAWQYADYLLDQGIGATASVRADRIQIQNQTGVPSRPAGVMGAVRCRIFAVQSWAAARLAKFVRSRANRALPATLRLTPDDAGMLNAMLFGDRSRLTHDLRAGFEKTGSFHLFVVSGMHVALLAGMIFWVARRMRLTNVAATALTLALTSAYALLTGFGVPVERALLMTAVFLLARLLSRSRNVLNALGAAALAVLVWSPHALFEASFQMTFLAVTAIAGIAIPLGERSFLPHARAARHLRDRWRDAALPPRLAQLRVMLRMWCEALAGGFGHRAYLLPSALLRAGLWAAELGLIGIVAEAVMALPMAMYFHRVTVFALPANMLSIPLVAILAPLGLVTFLCSLISSWLATIPGAALAILLHTVSFSIQHLSHARAADIRAPGPTAVHACITLAVLAFCCWAVRRSRKLAIAGVAALALVPIAALWPSNPDVHAGRLEVTAIDVGQGDSLLLVGPTGPSMVIDAGGPTGAAANAENATGSTTFDVGEEVVSPYLWSRQMRRIDVLVLTHAHSDHMGGMPAVLRNFHPRELWVGSDPDSARYRELLAEAAALGVRVRHLHAGDRIRWDSVDIDVLAPARTYVNFGPPANDDSLVLHMQFGRASALLEGDAQAASEDAMVAEAGRNPQEQIGPVTLLKVAHHGSRTSTTQEFVALAAPRDAVISVGSNNTFGHPRAEVIDRLTAAHAQVYRTDREGLTTFLLSPDGSISATASASNP